MNSYERCEDCKNIIIKEGDEKILKCPYCNSDRGFVKASEREWRTFFIGTMMQPYRFNKIKPSTQTTFVIERGKEERKEGTN